MKKLILSFFSVMLFASAVSAQTPDLINYQAAIRNSSGVPLASTSVPVRFTVRDLTAAGSILYQETNSAMTNTYGIMNTTIGGGTIVTGIWGDIDWSNGDKFLEVEVDAGAGLVSIGAQQLLSVPYSQYTKGVQATNGGGYGLKANGTSNLWWGFYEAGLYRGYLGSYSGKNEDVDFGTGAGNTTGSTHLVIGAVPKLTVDSIGRVGIGTTYPNSMLQVKGVRTSAYLGNVTVTNTPGVGYFPAIFLVDNATTPVGINLVGSSTNALNVVNPSTGSYAAANGSAFNVISDKTMKKEIKEVTQPHYATYMNQIRSIESATYRYNWENENTRQYPHVGFIAQSLPQEVTTAMDENPNGGTGSKIGYNLSDMAGLTIIGLKALDAQITAQQALIEKLEKRIAELETKK